MQREEIAMASKCTAVRETDKIRHADPGFGHHWEEGHDVVGQRKYRDVIHVWMFWAVTR